MKIGIYNSSFDNAAEGDTSAAILALALAAKHQTEFIRASGATTPEQLRLLCDRPLERVAFRTVDDPPQFVTDPGSPERRYQALRNWSHELTRPYDLFVNFSDRLPLYCSAPRGVLAVKFPYDIIPSLYRSFWLEHLSSYQLTISTSYYTQFWTRMFWKTDGPVVYPPVTIRNAYGTKENLIVTAGAFQMDGPHKHLELISAFKVVKSQLPEWSLVIIGEVDENRSSKLYFEAVLNAARDRGVTVMANPARTQLFQLFQRAKLFWLAAGLEENLELQPEKAVPFCWSLVQAMGAGCVPIVTNAGGNPELIRHGENGFFLDTVDDLIEHTLILARDKTLRLDLARAAGTRALDFLQVRFTESFQQQLKRTFGIRAPFQATPLSLWKRLVTSADQLFATRHG